MICAGLIAGYLSSFLLSGIDSARYLIEQLTVIPLEVPFSLIAGICVRKYGLHAGIVYVFAGVVGSFSPFYPEMPVTSLIFAKATLAGLIIGAMGPFPKGFAYRLAAASLPGFVLALFLGLPLVLHGATQEILESVKNEALEMYRAFMSPDNAANAADNALALIKGLFSVAFAVLFLCSIIQAWFSFLATGWVMRRSRVDTMPIPPMVSFSVPFPVIWVFLVCFGLVLSEYGPTFPFALNGLVITAGLYGFQGVSIVSYHMGRASFGRIPRTLFWLIFFITLAFSSVFLIVTGIVDNWFSLRPEAPRTGADDRGEGTNHESNS